MKPVFWVGASVLLASVVTPASAALIADPVVAVGPGNVIDPIEGEGIDMWYGTLEGTFEQRTDLRVLQTFGGFAGGSNTVAFTDAKFPDIEFALSGSPSALAGGELRNPPDAPKYFTSGDSSYHMRADDYGASFALTITFGTWDGSAFIGNRTVDSAALTLVDTYFKRTGTVTFRDMDDNPIAGAAFDYVGYDDWDAVGNHRDVFFGWDATVESSAPIGSIMITSIEADVPYTTALDDVAFTIVPEPGTFLGFVVALMTCLIVGLHGRRRESLSGP